MKWLRKLAANDKGNNVSYKFRHKRFKLFSELLDQLSIKNCTILDIGGTNYFWDNWKKFLPLDSKLFLINISLSTLTDYKGVVGDANNLSFMKNKSVDVVISNSLIEHLGDYKSQKYFANEVSRIGKYFFIQTPAFIFPIEPHFLFPFFHWMPKSLRIFLHQKINMGWFKRESNYYIAKKQIDEIRILKKREIKDMFDNVEIITERFFLLPKSYLITNMKK